MTHAQARYDELLRYASYYAWNARKGFALPGNDPFTGQPRSAWREQDRELSRIAYLAMAKECFARARRARAKSPIAFA